MWSATTKASTHPLHTFCSSTRPSPLFRFPCLWLWKKSSTMSSSKDSDLLGSDCTGLTSYRVKTTWISNDVNSITPCKRKLSSIHAHDVQNLKKNIISSNIRQLRRSVMDSTLIFEFPRCKSTVSWPPSFQRLRRAAQSCLTSMLDLHHKTALGILYASINEPVAKILEQNHHLTIYLSSIIVDYSMLVIVKASLSH